MKIISINVAQPEEVLIGGRPVLTGIYKSPVRGPVVLGKLGFAGDGQADLKVHGGEYQAVYGYPVEHYAHWEKRFARGPLTPGLFGENLTTNGLLETEVCVGDIFQMGTAQLQVTMHRLPCFKFAHKTGRADLLKDFLQSGHSGFYFKVVAEGVLSAGDTIVKIRADPHAISIRTLLGMHKLDAFDPECVRQALKIAVLPPLIRDFIAKLAAVEA